MKTMYEPEWHKILLKNLENALDLCKEAGIHIVDHNDFDYELKDIRYSPAQGKVIFDCKPVEKEEEE